VAENTSSGSPVVQRTRLHEQADNKDSNVGSLMDDDLLQYYEFLADKGDVQAQVSYYSASSNNVLIPTV
jgi:hypothetical protein